MDTTGWLSRDGFRGADGILGGDLVDLNTPAAGRDKVQHLVAGGLLALLLVRWTPLGPWAALVGVLLVASAWEVVELVRYRRWRRAVEAGAGSPWPFAADRMSWRDVVATVGGAALAVLTC
jgi:hypothetical protein